MVVLSLLAGSALGAIGGLIGGIGKKKANNAAAKAATENALLAEQGEKLTRAGTALDLTRMTRAGFRTQGSISAAAGASGLKTSGSALDVLRDSASNIALDKQLRGMQGELDAQGYKAKANDYRAQAAGLKAQKPIIGSVLSGAASILTSGAF